MDATEAGGVSAHFRSILAVHPHLGHGALLSTGVHSSSDPCPHATHTAGYIWISSSVIPKSAQVDLRNRPLVRRKMTRPFGVTYGRGILLTSCVSTGAGRQRYGF